MRYFGRKIIKETYENLQHLHRFEEIYLKINKYVIENKVV
jgi:hypothetical protein